MNQITLLDGLGYSPEQIEAVKKTVAVNATNEELFMFLSLASKYNLDPFAKEIFFIKYGTKPTIITSRDGYLKVAQADPNYKGLNSFVVHENDDFSIDSVKSEVNHKFNFKDRGKIVGAWARCERKGRNAVVCFVPFSEYQGAGDIWKKYPSAMIQKVAEVFALKRQFGISGLVTQEELDAEGPKPEVKDVTPPKVSSSKLPEPPKEPKISLEERDHIVNIFEELCIRRDNGVIPEDGRVEKLLRKACEIYFNVPTVEALNAKQAVELIERINAQLEELQEKSVQTDLVEATEQAEAKENNAEAVAEVFEGDVIQG